MDIASERGDRAFERVNEFDMFGRVKHGRLAVLHPRVAGPFLQHGQPSRLKLCPGTDRKVSTAQLGDE